MSVLSSVWFPFSALKLCDVSVPQPGKAEPTTQPADVISLFAFSPSASTAATQSDPVAVARSLCRSCCLPSDSSARLEHYVSALITQRDSLAESKRNAAAALANRTVELLESNEICIHSLLGRLDVSNSRVSDVSFINKLRQELDTLITARSTALTALESDLNALEHQYAASLRRSMASFSVDFGLRVDFLNSAMRTQFERRVAPLIWDEQLIGGRNQRIIRAAMDRLRLAEVEQKRLLFYSSFDQFYRVDYWSKIVQTESDRFRAQLQCITTENPGETAIFQEVRSLQEHFTSAVEHQIKQLIGLDRDRQTVTAELFPSTASLASLDSSLSALSSLFSESVLQSSIDQFNYIYTQFNSRWTDCLDQAKEEERRCAAELQRNYESLKAALKSTYDKIHGNQRNEEKSASDSEEAKCLGDNEFDPESAHSLASVLAALESEFAPQLAARHSRSLARLAHCAQDYSARDSHYLQQVDRFFGFLLPIARRLDGLQAMYRSEIGAQLETLAQWRDQHESDMKEFEQRVRECKDRLERCSEREDLAAVWAEVESMIGPQETSQFVSRWREFSERSVQFARSAAISLVEKLLHMENDIFESLGVDEEGNWNRNQAIQTAREEEEIKNKAAEEEEKEAKTKGKEKMKKKEKLPSPPLSTRKSKEKESNDSNQTTKQPIAKLAIPKRGGKSQATDTEVSNPAPVITIQSAWTRSIEAPPISHSLEDFDISVFSLSAQLPGPIDSAVSAAGSALLAQRLIGSHTSFCLVRKSEAIARLVQTGTEEEPKQSEGQSQSEPAAVPEAVVSPRVKAAKKDKKAAEAAEKQREELERLERERSEAEKAAREREEQDRPFAIDSNGIALSSSGQPFYSPFSFVNGSGFPRLLDYFRCRLLEWLEAINVILFSVENERSRGRETHYRTEFEKQIREAGPRLRELEMALFRPREKQLEKERLRLERHFGAVERVYKKAEQEFQTLADRSSQAIKQFQDDRRLAAFAVERFQFSGAQSASLSQLQQIQQKIVKARFALVQGFSEGRTAFQRFLADTRASILQLHQQYASQAEKEGKMSGSARRAIDQAVQQLESEQFHFVSPLQSLERQIASEATLEPFDRVYSTKLAQFATEFGIGYDAGAPKRELAAQIRQEIMKSESESEEMSRLMAELRDLSAAAEQEINENQSRLPSIGVSAILLKRESDAISTRLLSSLGRLRSLIYRRAIYLDFVPSRVPHWPHLTDEERDESIATAEWNSEKAQFNRLNIAPNIDARPESLDNIGITANNSEETSAAQGQSLASPTAAKSASRPGSSAAPRLSSPSGSAKSSKSSKSSLSPSGVAPSSPVLSGESFAAWRRPREFLFLLDQAILRCQREYCNRCAAPSAAKEEKERSTPSTPAAKKAEKSLKSPSNRLATAAAPDAGYLTEKSFDIRLVPGPIVEFCQNERSKAAAHLESSRQHFYLQLETLDSLIARSVDAVFRDIATRADQELTKSRHSLDQQFRAQMNEYLQARERHFQRFKPSLIKQSREEWAALMEKEEKRRVRTLACLSQYYQAICNLESAATSVLLQRVAHAATLIVHLADSLLLVDDYSSSPYALMAGERRSLSKRMQLAALTEEFSGQQISEAVQNWKKEFETWKTMKANNKRAAAEKEAARIQLEAKLKDIKQRESGANQNSGESESMRWKRQSWPGIERTALSEWQQTIKNIEMRWITQFRGFFSSIAAANPESVTKCSWLRQCREAERQPSEVSLPPISPAKQLKSALASAGTAAAPKAERKVSLAGAGSSGAAPSLLNLPKAEKGKSASAAQVDSLPPPAASLCPSLSGLNTEFARQSIALRSFAVSRRVDSSREAIESAQRAIGQAIREEADHWEKWSSMTKKLNL